MGPEPKPSQLVQRIERARRVVSHCSQAAIRAYDEEALLSEACRHLIDAGTYCMAWFGESKDGNAPVAPLAHAGSEPSGVRSAQPPWMNDVGLRSPTLRALREQRPQVLRGISSDPVLQLRHPDAGRLGYAAVCAFPIQFGPHGAGVLTIFAREPDAFAPEEVALLRELAGDMGVGVSVLRAKLASDLLEEKLEAAEQRYRGLVEQAPVGICQVSPDGNLLLANKALGELLGYATPADLMVQTPAELAQHLSAADLQRINDMVHGGSPYPPLALQVRRRDGQQVWVDVQAQPGNVGRDGPIEAFVRDLTAERAASLAATRLSAVVDASDEAVIGIDVDGAVRSWSLGATALYGFTAADAVGQPFAAVCVPEDRQDEWAGVLRVLARGQRVPRFDTKRLCMRRDLVDVSVTANPVLDAGGQVVGASLVEHDIRDRLRAQTMLIAQERQKQEVLHLQELVRMRAEFMGKASHELNTPLTPVLLQVQALRETGTLDAKQSLGLAVIERNVLRLAALVKDLMTASRINSSRLDLRPSALDLTRLVADAVESVQAQARKAGVVVQAEAAGPVPVFADRDRVMQVLFNVIGNAIKYTPRDGSITVRATEEDDLARLTVADNGLGFDPGARANLFRPFGRLHEHLPGSPAGTGLGLFISKGIVEASGGTMSAESPGAGKGATFGFTLPRRAPAPPGRGIVAATGFHAEAEAVGPAALQAPAAPAPRGAQDAVGRTRSR